MLKARIVHCAKVCPHTFHRYRHPRLRLRLVHLPREQERYLRKLWLRVTLTWAIYSTHTDRRQAGGAFRKRSARCS